MLEQVVVLPLPPLLLAKAITAVDEACNAGRKNRIRFVGGQHQPHHVCFVGIQRERAARLPELGIFARRVDDRIEIIDVLRLEIMYFFPAQRLREGSFSRRDTADQNNFFHQVLVSSQQV